MTGPPDGGDGSDLEDFDDETGPNEGLPADTGGEFDVFVDGNSSSDSDEDCQPKEKRKIHTPVFPIVS